MKREQKIAELFAAVVEKEPSARRDFLKAECGVDNSLFAEVEALLGSFDAAQNNSFMSAPAIEVEAAHFARDEETDSRIGETIGHYKITEKIGTGGMGAVYRAERSDGEFSQTVAFKFIKGGFDSKEIIRRFRNERAILAALNHPFIARLIDGGATVDGLPYIVMEHVEGLPVNEFCRRENLSLADRLELFRKICAAVAGAHRNLIIHRDLKPSNILIDAAGEPKLLDFGIAKLYSADGAAETETRTDFRALTPEYASPEQLRGEQLTTATDIYSLGVILYEILTGTRPFDTRGKTFAEVFRLISEVEPHKPSDAFINEANPESQLTDFKLQKSTDEQQPATGEEKSVKSANQRPTRENLRLLRGDLDNIVLKALRKEPERRYLTVQEFSEDVRRYLAGLPVMARGDTLAYRAEKFVSRNRTAVAVSLLLMLALLGGVAATVWQWRIARTERAKAETRFESLRKSSRSMVSEIHAAMMNLPGSLEARKLLLQRAVEQLDALSVDAADNRQLQLDLADAYQNIGYLPDKSIAERTELFNKSIAFYERILAEEPKNIEARKGLAMSKVNLADFARLRSETDEALKHNREAVALLESVVADAPENLKHKTALWNVSYNAALTLTQTGRAAEALEICQRMLPVAVELREKDSSDPSDNKFRRPYLSRGLASNNLIYLGRYDEAITEIRTALEENAKTRALFPDGMIERLDESVFNWRLAMALERSGKAEEAIEAMKKSLTLVEELANADRKDSMYRTSAAQFNSLFGHMLVRSKRYDEAIKHFNRAIELDEAAIAADTEQKQAKADLAYAYGGRGAALAKTGKPAEGLADERQAMALYDQLGATNSSNAVLLRDYAETLAQTGETYLIAGAEKSPEKAREFLSKSLAVWLLMQERGILNRFDAEQPEKIRNLIEQISR